MHTYQMHWIFFPFQVLYCGKLMRDQIFHYCEALHKKLINSVLWSTVFLVKSTVCNKQMSQMAVQSCCTGWCESRRTVLFSSSANTDMTSKVGLFFQIIKFDDLSTTLYTVWPSDLPSMTVPFCAKMSAKKRICKNEFAKTNYIVKFTWQPIYPSFILPMSVCDHLDLAQGSRYFRLWVKFTVSSLLCRNFRMFQGRSLCLKKRWNGWRTKCNFH